jgi:hypothetical protein
MPLTLSQLGAEYRAAYNADKPLILGDNLLRHCATVPRFNTTGSWSTASGTSATAPATRLYDDFHHLATRPASTATTTYLLFDLEAGYRSFDSCLILGHNLDGGVFGNTTITLQVSNSDSDGTFSSVTDIRSLTVTTAKRIGLYNLSNTGFPGPNVYTHRYVRLKIVSSGSFAPSISEVWLSLRRALPRHPSVPYGDSEHQSSIITTTTESGIQKRYIQNVGRRMIEAEWDIDEEVYTTGILAFGAESSYLARPFVYVPRPLTQSDYSYVMTQDEARFSFPFVGATNHRRFSLSMGEVAPYRANE